MHGRKRPTRPPTEAELEAKRQKIALYVKLKDQVLKRFKLGLVADPASAQLTAKLCALNPDFSTAWNFRRQIFHHQFQAAGEAAASDADRSAAQTQVLRQELQLTQAALGNSPKSYCCWFYRKHLVGLGLVGFQSELVLCDKFLSLDSRNFHCWNHRRWVVAQLLAAVPVGAGGPEQVGSEAEAEVDADAAESAPAKEPEARRLAADAAAVRLAAQAEIILSELRFTMDKVADNFSNFSAWHHRSVCLAWILDYALPRGYRLTTETLEELQQPAQADCNARTQPAAAQEKAGDGEAAVDTVMLQQHLVLLEFEFQTAKQAFYVEPQDESTWLYHRWLLGRVLALADSRAAAGLGVPGGLGDAASLFLSGSSGGGLLELGKSVAERLGSKPAAPQEHTAEEHPASAALRIPKARAEHVVRRELELVEDILRIEPSARFASLHRLLLLGVLYALHDGCAEEGPRLAAAIRELCQRLQEQDPQRARYYQHLEARAAAR